jgi:predicted NUDIX family phosphoesterase
MSLDKMEEKVYCVERKKLFNNDEFNGIKSKDEVNFNYSDLQNGIFLYRKKPNSPNNLTAELDASFKQIIPYIILKHDNKFFCYGRTSKAGEDRLHQKYSLGIGGHINPCDSETVSENDIIVDGALRELNEEIEFSGEPNFEFVGYLNSEEDEVSKVHLGLVYFLNLDSPNVVLKEEELEDGKFLSLDELDALPNLEDWAKKVLNFLKQKHN